MVDCFAAKSFPRLPTYSISLCLAPASHFDTLTHQTNISIMAPTHNVKALARATRTGSTAAITEAKLKAGIVEEDEFQRERDQVEGELDGAILEVVEKLTDEIAHTNSPEHVATIKAKLAGTKPEESFPLLYWAPVVYVLAQYFYLRLPFDGFFWIHFIYMLTLTAFAAYVRTQAINLQTMVDEHNAFCVSKNGESAAHVDKAASTIKVAGKRLTRYKTEYDDMKIKLRDAQNDLLKSQRDHTTSLQSNIDLYHKCRKLVNKTRLQYFQSRHSHQQDLINTLDKLIRKFKNVSVPKVKGVSPKKSNSNGLTGPLERMATGLKNGQRVTEKQVKVAQKVQELLELDAVNWEETDRMIKRAEDTLGQTGMEHASDEPVSASSEIEVDLERHFDRMEAYLQRTAKGAAALGQGDGMAVTVTKS
jgi:hypothetical protein